MSVWQPGGAARNLEVQTDAGTVQRVIRFEAGGVRVPVWYLTCPRCSCRAELDDAQLRANVSVVCPRKCGFHETFNYAASVTDALAAEEPR